MKKNIAIIGSGFSSLSAACYLAKAGHNVTIYEKNDALGGRARQFKAEGFTFDMGPSWYWMPDVFDKFFNDFGKKVSDYFTLTKLSPAYRVYFGKDDFIDIEDTPEKICKKFESIEKGSGEKLKKYTTPTRYIAPKYGKQEAAPMQSTAAPTTAAETKRIQKVHGKLLYYAMQGDPSATHKAIPKCIQIT